MVPLFRANFLAGTFSSDSTTVYEYRGLAPVLFRMRLSVAAVLLSSASSVLTASRGGCGGSEFGRVSMKSFGLMLVFSTLSMAAALGKAKNADAVLTFLFGYCQRIATIGE